MPTAKLNVTIPDSVWIGAVSREFPGATFRVLAALPQEESGVGLVSVRADDLPGVVAAMQSRDGVATIEVLETADDEALLQFETDEPVLLFSVRDAGLPLEPPVEVADGVAALEVTASRERLASLGDQLSMFGLDFDLEYVRQSVGAESLLTDTQRDLLETAVECGYYDTPRRCSLTELADRVGLAKSTASETLHRAEETVVKHFVEDLPPTTLGR